MTVTTEEHTSFVRRILDRYKDRSAEFTAPDRIALQLLEDLEMAVAKEFDLDVPEHMSFSDQSLMAIQQMFHCASSFRREREWFKARVRELEEKFSEQRISDAVYVDWHRSLKPSERAQLSLHTLRELVNVLLSDERKDGE